MRSRGRAGLAPAATLAAVVVATYAQFVGEFFQGNDTWAHLWTSRDVRAVLTRPIMAGTPFPDALAHFYRPVSTLSYTLDLALAGLNPLAFHLTDLAIHLAASLALFALLRLLGPRPWAAAAGAATFALHPVMVAVVPDLPRRHDSLAAAGLFGALALAAWSTTRPAAPRARRALAWAGSPVLLLLAEGAKESAFMGPPLLAPTLLVAALAAGRPLRGLARPVLGTLSAWGAASLALFAWRFAVLGGIGGYHGQIDPLVDLDVALNDLLRTVLWPFRALLQTYLRAWLTELGLAVLVTGLPLLVARPAVRATLVYGWLWVLACGAFQALTKALAPWHAYLTVASLGVLAAGVLDAAADAPCLIRAAAWPRAGGRRLAVRLAHLAALAVGAVGVLVYQAGVLRESAVLTRYDEWHVAGEVGRRYLAAIAPCLAATPADWPVVLDDYPYGLDDSTDGHVLTQAGVLTGYALGPAVALAEGRPDLVVRGDSRGVVFARLPDDIAATCGARDGAWHVQARYVGGGVSP